MTGDCRANLPAITNLPPPPPSPTAQSNRNSSRAEEDANSATASASASAARAQSPRDSKEADRDRQTAQVHVGGDGAELHGVLRGVRPRLRGHRPHPHPPPPRLRRRRPQAKRLRRRPIVLPRRHRLRSSAGPQGAGGGVAAGEVVPQERARGSRGRVDQGGGQVRQGGRGRRALPAQGEPAGLRRVRPAPPRAPGQVLLPLHHQEVRQRRDQAGGRRERDGVRAHVRGQGRRLDARRRRPLEDVCGSLPTPSSDEELRGRQLSTKSCPMKHAARPL